MYEIYLAQRLLESGDPSDTRVSIEVQGLSVELGSFEK